MTKIVAAACIALFFAICIARPAVAGCVAIGWTNGHHNHPIWQCSD